MSNFKLWKKILIVLYVLLCFNTTCYAFNVDIDKCIDLNSDTCINNKIKTFFFTKDIKEFIDKNKNLTILKICKIKSFQANTLGFFTVVYEEEY